MTRRAVCVAPALVALALCAPREANADPIATRSPVEGRAVSVALGVPEGSVSIGLSPSLALSFDYRVGTAAGVGLALRRTLLGRELGWALETASGLSLRALRFGPRVGVELSPSLLLRHRWSRFYGAAALVLPMTLTSEPTVRVAPMLELWLGARAGAVWLGFAGGVGAAVTAGYEAAPVLQGTVTASVPY